MKKVKTAQQVRLREGIVQISGSLAEIAAKAASCRNCDLWRNATQTVFGEGGAHPRIMLIGEQPGIEEDKEGHPFVGPAGRN